MKAFVNNSTSMEDSELVREAQNGNRNAFSELVRRYQSASIKLAVTVLGNREDAEDEVQNAMCKAFERLGQFQHHSEFSTWLHRIVLNQSLMRLRQLKRQPTIGLEFDSSGIFRCSSAASSADHESPENRISREQLARMLDDEVRCLPPVLRSALVLRDLEELPFPSVAQELGITVPAVKSRLVRARGELKSRLKRRYVFARP